MRVVIDISLTQICTQQQPLLEQPTSIPSTSSTTQQQICLSLLVLLIPYLYLLYLHIEALYFCYSKNIMKQLDTLDKWMIGLSMLRVLVVFSLLGLSHFVGETVIAILGLIWEMGLAMVYFRFVVEGAKYFGYFVFGIAFIYGIVMIVYNHVNIQNSTLVVPILYPLLFIDIFISCIAVHEFIQIHQVLHNKTLTQTITIQLKSRRAFIFTTLITCWVSFIMRCFPQIFKPILGVVLYFVISDWLNMAIIYRNVLGRIVRSNQDDEISESQGRGRDRRSDMVVVQVEMENYQKL